MASLSTPTQLATFSQPHASSSKSSHITLNPVIGDSGCAVAAVKGDGVWTYNLSTLRPTTSFTVPPSTVFTTSPISYWSTKLTPTTVDVAEDMDVDDDEEEEGKAEVTGEKERITMIGVDKEIWAWKGDDGDKEVIHIGKSTKFLHFLQSSIYPVVAISTNNIYLIDAEFKAQNLTIPFPSSDIVSSRILSPKENSARLVIVDKEGKVAVYHLILEATPRLENVIQGKIGEGKLTFADISEDGSISALDESNRLYTREISSLSSALIPLHLNHPSPTPVLLSLPTKGKPLILLPTLHPTPSILLAIPLSTIPAVLNTTSISTFISTGAITNISILSTKNGIITVGVVLSHLNSDGESGRSVIYTTEVVIPAKGIGMGMLLGTKEQTETYLSPSTDSTVKSHKTEVEKAQDEILQRITTALKKNDIPAVEKAWNDYVVKADPSALTEIFVKKIVNAVFSAALKDGKLNGPYPASIVKGLVERGLINDAMWKEGVVGAGLLPCGDWDTILVCLQNLRTIPSATLVKLLESSLHPLSGSSSPKISNLLRSIISSPPAPTFRLDIRQKLSVEDATSVLEQLVSWAEEHVLRRDEGLRGWDSGSPMPDPESLPSLNSVITYSSLLLDAHLPSFLSYEPSHTLLERFQVSLEPLMAIQTEYRQLRGPVEAVLTLSRREARKAEEKQMQQNSKGRQTDRKNNGKERGDTGARLPEEKVGKWKVEDLVF
ncbi:uncharacterized protein IL334_004252 [Kwoniella shivajii]|uniref:Uncharacterized protein n=1 Tax=Kwoniella shivajii TaxID=564305 RepID=A0ABZ1CZU1_9TREE|nr:hypothetical protein IL334_004252 [Kwoniella shivajii]